MSTDIKQELEKKQEQEKIQEIEQRIRLKEENLTDKDISSLTLTDIETREEFLKLSPLLKTILLKLDDDTLTLIDMKADIECVDNQNRTPLQWTLRHEQQTLINALLARGANVEARNKDGRTPISRAVTVDGILSLLAHKADINAADNTKMTALHWAPKRTDRRYANIIPLLVEKGADPEARDNQGKTPLMGINAGTILPLLDAKACVHAVDNDNRTPLHWVVFDNRRSCVPLLVRRGASLEALDNKGWTPIAWRQNTRSGRQRGADYNKIQTLKFMKTFQQISTIFEEGYFQCFLDLVELEYDKKVPEDHLLTKDRKQLLEILDQILEKAKHSFFAQHETILNIAAANLQKPIAEIQKFVIDILHDDLTLFYLCERDPLKFWQPFINAFVDEKGEYFAVPSFRNHLYQLIFQYNDPKMQPKGFVDSNKEPDSPYTTEAAYARRTMLNAYHLNAITQQLQNVYEQNKKAKQVNQITNDDKGNIGTKRDKGDSKEAVDHTVKP